MQYYSIIDAQGDEHDIETTSKEYAEEWAQIKHGENCYFDGLKRGTGYWALVAYTVDAEGKKHVVSNEPITIEYDGGAL